MDDGVVGIDDPFPFIVLCLFVTSVAGVLLVAFFAVDAVFGAGVAAAARLFFRAVFLTVEHCFTLFFTYLL